MLQVAWSASLQNNEKRMALTLASDVKYESTELALKRISSLYVQRNSEMKRTLNKKSYYSQDDTTINLKTKENKSSILRINKVSHQDVQYVTRKCNGLNIAPIVKKRFS